MPLPMSNATLLKELPPSVTTKDICDNITLQEDVPANVCPMNNAGPSQPEKTLILLNDDEIMQIDGKLKLKFNCNRLISKKIFRATLFLDLANHTNDKVAPKNVIEHFSLLKTGSRRLSGCKELLDNKTVEESSNVVNRTLQEQDPVEWLADVYYKKFIEEFKENDVKITLPPKWIIRKNQHGIYAQFFDDVDKSIQTVTIAAKTVITDEIIYLFYNYWLIFFIFRSWHLKRTCVS